MEDAITNSFVPADMARRAEASAIRKANRDTVSAFFLAVQAGSFVAFGAALFTSAVHDSTLGAGLTRLIGGVTFSLGLILVIIAGADLFTGDTLMIMGCLSRKVTVRQMLRSWGIVFTGNLVGSLAIVALIHFSGHWTAGQGAIGVKALEIADAKVNITFLQAFSSGMLCNILVCLAIWLCQACRSVADKILAILFPITAFVALGFEHSIANMYFIPAGMILKHNPALTALLPNVDFSAITLHGFVVRNMIPVVCGNMIGGAIFVGAVYWILYLRKSG